VVLISLLDSSAPNFGACRSDESVLFRVTSMLNPRIQLSTITVNVSPIIALRYWQTSTHLRIHSNLLFPRCPGCSFPQLRTSTVSAESLSHFEVMYANSLLLRKRDSQNPGTDRWSRICQPSAVCNRGHQEAQYPDWELARQPAAVTG